MPGKNYGLPKRLTRALSAAASLHDTWAGPQRCAEYTRGQAELITVMFDLPASWQGLVTAVITGELDFAGLRARLDEDALDIIARWFRRDMYGLTGSFAEPSDAVALLEDVERVIAGTGRRVTSRKGQRPAGGRH